jgi:hypothetical protein
MKRATPLGLTLALFLYLGACAGNPGPGEAGYPYNLNGSYSGEVVVEGEAFSLTFDVETRAEGSIRGTYAVTSPVSMSGQVTGAVVADSVSFRLSYTNPMDGCGGTFDGTGVVEEGGDAFSGRARVNDSCGGYLSGTFALRR